MRRTELEDADRDEKIQTAKDQLEFDRKVQAGETPLSQAQLAEAQAKLDRSLIENNKNVQAGTAVTISSNWQTSLEAYPRAWGELTDEKNPEMAERLKLARQILTGKDADDNKVEKIGDTELTDAFVIGYWEELEQTLKEREAALAFQEGQKALASELGRHMGNLEKAEADEGFELPGATPTQDQIDAWQERLEAAHRPQQVSEIRGELHDHMELWAEQDGNERNYTSTSDFIASKYAEWAAVPRSDGGPKDEEKDEVSTLISRFATLDPQNVQRWRAVEQQIERIMNPQAEQDMTQFDAGKSTGRKEAEAESRKAILEMSVAISALEAELAALKAAGAK